MILSISNSFTTVVDSTSQIDELLNCLLTYKNDIEGAKGQIFFGMKMAKRRGNKQQYFALMKKLKELEETEFVNLYKDGKFPTGLLNIVNAALQSAGYKYEIKDTRLVPPKTAILRWNNKPYDPRYYQRNMIDLNVSQGRGVTESAVGTGKSLVMAWTIYELSVVSLIVVPSSGLSDQLYNDFVVWFGAKNVEFIDASKVRDSDSFKPIRIITIQSLSSLYKSGEADKLLNDVDAIHCDEIHHAGSSSYADLLPALDSIYYRFGYTGTFLRNDNKTLEMWGFLSNVLYSYPAHQAIEEGFLTPMHVVVHQLEGKFNKKYPKEYEANYCGNFSMMERIKSICEAVDQNSQVLILVKNKDKSGLVIHEYLNQFGIPNAYISGDNKKKEITQTIINFNDKKINILIGSSVIGEGIDIRSTDHLIMAQGEKSEITIVQATGRLIRLFEGKTMGYLHDFRFSETKYLEGHLIERLSIYKRNFKCEVNYAQG